MRKLRTTAIGVAGVIAGAFLSRRRALIEPVAEELRSPALWFPFQVTSDRAVRTVRAVLSRAPVPEPAPGVRVETREVPRRDGGRIRLLVHQSETRSEPSGALLYIHGGGLVFGVPEQATELCNAVAEQLGVLVANVEYRLAPEHPFPAGLDDCMDALQWLHDSADELGLDRERLAVAGDSAGGGLSAAVAQRALDEGGPQLAFQALIYPMLDDRTVLRTDHGGRGSFAWTPASNAYAWTAYLSHAPGETEDRPYAAPARRDDLSGLPPAWIGVGDLDLFHDEDVDYARRLEAAGIPCELYLQPGGYHAADVLVPKADASRAFRQSMIDALAGAIAAERPARR